MWLSLIRVDDPNESYNAPEEAGGPVANWFEMPDLGDVEVEEVEIADDVYSTRNSLGQLIENKKAKAVVQKYLGDVEASPGYGMMEGMPINALAELAPEQFNEKTL